MKLRAARFLNADKPKQEKMLAEFNWTSQQVEPLMEVFQKDVSLYESSFLKFAETLHSVTLVER